MFSGSSLRGFASSNAALCLASALGGEICHSFCHQIYQLQLLLG